MADSNGSDPLATYPALRKTRRNGQQRVRVTRACDNCKKRKSRCSGTIPCSVCTRRNLSCNYEVSYNRGKLPLVPESNSSRVDSGSGSFDPSVSPDSQPNNAVSDGSSVPEGTFRTGRSPQHMAPMAPASSWAADAMRPLPSKPHGHKSWDNAPEPPDADVEGHYIGPSSGISFLLQVQKRMRTTTTFHNTSIFTFGDAELPKSDPSFLILPSKIDAATLVDRFFEFAFPTHRFLHQPTVEGWVEDLYKSGPGTNVDKISKDQKALIFMIMAQAMQYVTNEQILVAYINDSAAFFRASERQLEEETGPVRLPGIQARLLQCFYLLTQSRLNHCWNAFGVTARLILAIGLHRNRRPGVPGVKDNIDVECRKRVFWCAYSLDNYLSAALGRPRMFHDEDLDQDLPAVANDRDIISSEFLPSAPQVQSIMFAAVHQVRLSKIISGILRDLYGIRRQSTSTQLVISRRYDSKLQRWRQGTTTFLDLTDASLLRTIFQRQHSALRLAYAHAKILVHRPFLLGSFAGGRGSSSEQQAEDQHVIDANIDECMSAAREIAEIVQDMCNRKQMFKAFWFTHYYTFCAAVVLYLHVLQCCATVPATSWTEHFAAALQCQSNLSASGSQDSFAQRGAMLLEILRSEVSAKTASAIPPLVEEDSHTGRDDVAAGGLEDASLASVATAHQIPGTTLWDFAEWSELDTLMAAGFGNLDAVLQIGEENFLGGDGESLGQWMFNVDRDT